MAFSAGCQLSKEHTLLREGNVTDLASQSMSSLPNQADEPSTAGGRSQLSAEGKLGYIGGWGGGKTFATIQHSGMRNATSTSPNKMQPASSFRRSGLEESPFQSQPGPLGSSCEGPELGGLWRCRPSGKGSASAIWGAHYSAVLPLSNCGPSEGDGGLATFIPGLGLGCVTGWGRASLGPAACLPEGPSCLS